MDTEFTPIKKIVDEVPAIRVPHLLADVIRWSQYDGAIPYVFRDKAPGHRCAWTCKWVVGSNGVNSIVNPSDWWPDDISARALVYEIRDLRAMLGIYRLATDSERFLLEHYDERDVNQVAQVRDVIKRFRTRYPEYLCKDKLPTNINSPAFRPGW
jgi:hypothetical protein